jgi:hypothetical protein
LKPLGHGRQSKVTGALFRLGTSTRKLPEEQDSVAPVPEAAGVAHVY